MITTDFLIVGSGIVGLSIARELIARHPDLKIVLLEKESALSMHASGRNSGVIHAGFYYDPVSLKAQLTRDGNKLLTEYCLTHNLAIERCGKVVVAKNENEGEQLFELKRRGDKNSVELELVDEDQLRELEPNAKTFEKALYSPSTSSVDPVEVVKHIADKLRSHKVDILFNEEFMDFSNGSTIETRKNKIQFKYLINAAGLYADKVAHKAGAGHNYSIIPFKGLYLGYKDDSLIKKLIYPVPDLNNPFLGVHFTRTVRGHIKIGPTAIPAFWRENYQGFSNFRFKELLDSLSTGAMLFFQNSFDFRKTIFMEMKKYNKKSLIQHASRRIKHIDNIK